MVFLDYNNMQKIFFCVLFNSGTLSEESTILGFAGILLGTSAENPEDLDRGIAVIGGIKNKDVN